MPHDFLSVLSAELAADPDTRDLAESLPEICAKLADHWAVTHLTWFTDHGVGHAHRVARRAIELSTLPNPPADIGLSPLEQYILYVASLLHDIGMNDLSLSPRPLGEMVPADYVAIRHGHSARSGSMILSSPATWGLPPDDPTLAELVGLVAQAHGTKNYRATIPLLEQRTRVREQPVRGPLLAALLLMADELDLYYGREVNLGSAVQLNAISEAHAFKHRCITSASSRIQADGTICLDLILSIPDDLSDDARTDIERWIIGKLRRQMALVDPEMVEGFAKHLRFDRAIGVKYVSSLSRRTSPSAQALAVIRAEVVVDDLIDHRDKLRRSTEALSNGHIVITGKWNAETHSDFHGREDLFDAAVETSLADSKVILACSRRLHELGSGEVSDVLEEWLNDLDPAHGSPATEQESEAAARAGLLDACVAAITEMDNDRLLVLAVSCFDRLGNEGMRWITNAAIPAITAASGPTLRLLISSDDETPVPTVGPLVVVIPTEEIETAEVIEYLRGVGLEDAETLAESELPYYSLKRICDLKSMRLQRQG